MRGISRRNYENLRQVQCKAALFKILDAGQEMAVFLWILLYFFLPLASTVCCLCKQPFLLGFFQAFNRGLAAAGE